MVPSNENGIGTFTVTKSYSVKGNIMSLLYEDDFDGKINLLDKEYAFSRLFKESNTLIDASELCLSAKVLSLGCYSEMFKNCSQLDKLPNLNATVLGENCYQEMFYGCTSLEYAQDILPALVLSKGCYKQMFAGCTSLIILPNLPSLSIEEQGYYSMFEGCTALTSVLELPARFVGKEGYAYMFNRCTSLKNLPETLPATELRSYCRNCRKNCRSHHQIWNGTGSCLYREYGDRYRHPCGRQQYRRAGSPDVNDNQYRNKDR